MGSDVDAIRKDFRVSDVAASFGVALEKNGDEWEANCPFHSEDTPSFTVFTGKDRAERFHCFGCGERGDVLDFVQKIKGCNLPEAVRILDGGSSDVPNIAPRPNAEARDVYAGIVPIATGETIEPGREVRLYNPKRAGHEWEWGKFKPSMAHRYAPGMYVLRREMRDGGKETPMVCRVRLPSGDECWSRFPFPKPRPLYGLDRLRDGQVIIVEGEKCVDALRAATGRNVVSWAGGTQGVKYADWSPLEGRDVILWPDADEPGYTTMQNVGLAVAASRIRILDVADAPKGWDVADGIGEGWDRARIDGFMRERIRPFDARQPEPPPEIPAEPAVAVEESVEPPAVIDEPVDHGVSVLPPLAAEKHADLSFYDEIKALAGGRASNKTLRGGKPGVLLEWVYLSADNEFCRYNTGERMSRAAFDLAMAPVTPLIELPTKDGSDALKKLSPAKTLIEHLGGVVVSNTMYRPDVRGLVLERDGVVYMNSYLPSSVPDVDPNWEAHGAWKIVRDHIHNIIPDGGDMLIRWLAHNAQNPGMKILWAPIIVGVQGDGKTTIGKVAQAAMGAKNVQPVSPEAMFSDFTGWAEGGCVKVLEEIRVHGNSRATAMDKLKPLITNDNVEIVRKGKDGKQIANVTNYIALTNHMDALAIDEGDRRWGVLRTRFESREQVISELTYEYWSKLHDAIDCNPEVVRGWLLSIDLSDFNRHAAPPMSGAKMDMIEASRSALDADIREAISLGGYGVCPDVLATDCLNEIIKANGGRAASTSTMSNALRECGWIKFPATVKWDRKNRRVYYRREAFEGSPEMYALRLKLEDTARDAASDMYSYDPGPF